MEAKKVFLIRHKKSNEFKVYNELQIVKGVKENLENYYYALVPKEKIKKLHKLKDKLRNIAEVNKLSEELQDEINKFLSNCNYVNFRVIDIFDFECFLEEEKLKEVENQKNEFDIVGVFDENGKILDLQLYDNEKLINIWRSNLKDYFYVYNDYMEAEKYEILEIETNIIRK